MRHFLTWERPLLTQAVAWLAEGWSGEGPLDLSALLVIVPTRQSGRRLREALAEHAGAREQAVFPPLVMTPDALVAHELPAGAATRLESLLAWAEVLRGAELEEFRDVFPVDPPARNAAWALQLAEQLSRLQQALGEGGLRIADVVGRAGGDFPETERWRQLARLERAGDARLAEIDRRDERAVRIAAAGAPVLPAGVVKIVILATPDPLPLALRALAEHARAGAATVEVVVYAPPAEAENFDAWGRPVTEAWERRTIALPEFERRVRLCANPAEQAERIVAAAQLPAPPEGRLVVGVADAEVLPLAENALARADLVAFNPEGRPRVHDGLYALLTALAELAAAPGFETGGAVLRCPDVLEWLRGWGDGKFSAAQLLKQWDDLRGRHLPPTLAAARNYVGAFPAVEVGLAALSQLRATLTTGTFPENAAAALGMIFAGRRLEPDAALVDSAGVWMAVLRETGRAFAAWGGAELTLAEKWAVALGAFAVEARTAERPAGAIDLLGWLELLWENTPHLVLAGLNDGRVPDAIVGDLFLPEALRVRLGLKTNAERLARDAYLLTALAAWRHGGAGRLDVLVGKTSEAGDPLRPSRLLFRCEDEALPARVTQLFREVEAARPNLPWTRAWPLRPRRVPAPERVSVTALRDWLACPFRFYLKHALRMERVEPARDELDARDFGTLVHYALQELGESEELADCTDAGRLREFLLERFERVARLRHGAELTLPLVVQLETARQRLRATAEVEARERAAGWRTVRVEWTFAFPLGGLTISGKIDRIDRHADGRVRVIDYKTSDTAVAPETAHWRPPRAEDAARPEWIHCSDAEGKPRVWTDLQLPMYLRAVAAEWGDTVACGYFNLPKAAGGTALIMWEGYSRATQAAAERCAEGVAAAVVAGEFWPPRELTGREAELDDFAELFHHGAAASIAWEAGA